MCFVTFALLFAFFSFEKRAYYYYYYQYQYDFGCHCIKFGDLLLFVVSECVIRCFRVKFVFFFSLFGILFFFYFGINSCWLSFFFLDRSFSHRHLIFGDQRCLLTRSFNFGIKLVFKLKSISTVFAVVVVFGLLVWIMSMF